MRAAVVGHVEWIEFGRVDHVPAPGEIVHVSDSWQEPGGGGAVAASRGVAQKLASIAGSVVPKRVISSAARAASSVSVTPGRRVAATAARVPSAIASAVTAPVARDPSPGWALGLLTDAQAYGPRHPTR